MLDNQAIPRQDLRFTNHLLSLERFAMVSGFEPPVNSFFVTIHGQCQMRDDS